MIKRVNPFLTASKIPGSWWRASKVFPVAKLVVLAGKVIKGHVYNRTDIIAAFCPDVTLIYLRIYPHSASCYVR